MPVYAYRAVNGDGEAFEDTVEAISAYDLTQSLEAQGLRVTSIDFAGQAPGTVVHAKQLSWEELRLFTEQLGSIARSGYPLVPSLAALADELEQPRLRAATEQLQLDLEQGTSLGEAFRHQESRFPPLFGALVRAGELTGDLPTVLDMMNDHATRMASVKHRVKMALAYPLLLAICAVSVILYQLLYIVPVFSDIFLEMEAQPPAPTRFLLMISGVLRHHWSVVLIGAALVALALVAVYILLKRQAEGRRFLDRCTLYFPGIGMAYQGVVQARFCRTFALLLGARVPLIDALLLSGTASGSAVLEKAVSHASDVVAQGGRLVDGLRESHFFGQSFYWLLGTAEERGQVEYALNNLAESAERTVRTREQLLGSVITPALTIFLGLIIGFMVVALYMPIFTLGDQLGVN